MSISAYTGLPGSGKSYEVVNSVILAAILKGRVVWTNIPCKIDGVRIIEGDEAKGHWYLNAPPGSLCVVDECWRYWPAGMKADSIPEEHRSWFAEHRHRTLDGVEADIVLVTQDLSQVARFVRDLIDQTFRMRKLNAIGLSSRYRVDAYRGAVTGQRPPESQFISGQIRKYKREGFARYRSHTQGEAAKAMTVDGRASALRRPAIMILPLVLVGLLFAPQALRAVFGTVTGSHEAEPVAVASGATDSAPEPPAPAPVAPPAPAVPSGPVESSEWTLLGIVVRQDGTGRALLRSPTGRRVIDVRRCREAIEWACDVDGKMVAQWTGNGVLARAQGQTYNKANGG